MYIETPIKLGGKVINFNGPEEESLFHQTKTWCINENTPKELQNTIVNILKNVGDLDKDRHLVLVGSLLVENAIDQYLSAVIPGYKSMRIQNYSLKINLAKSIRLCPLFLFSCAHVIRKIRNDFVHDLSVDDFSKADPKNVAQLSSNLLKFDRTATLGTTSDNFRNVVIFLTIGLQLYTYHVKRLNDFIRSKEILQPLKEYCEQEGYGQF